MKSLVQNERGLTLIEILAALVILGIVLISVMSFFTQSAKFTAHNNEKLTNVQVAEEVIAEIRQGKYLSDTSFTREGAYKVEIDIKDGPENLELATVVVSSPEGAGIDESDFTTQMYFEVSP
ncbi:prepilin-type N-terminal cleavage/methylation domain-containing protein [Planomicrobium sp. CPCC 101079]|uniref:type IV pilus modification PilV family protein n=1 Tax=Planomicrobium sp. CPCC 101079 TaxID=2599618 RepID=UPI0011B5F2FA|nr:type II secretion system protein [Planomicrobium sp. CPCC 101079]TWT08960.1 type II secretion system protein [Planomicrobium sp. CPCC 101079]